MAFTRLCFRSPREYRTSPCLAMSALPIIVNWYFKKAAGICLPVHAYLYDNMLHHHAPPPGMHAHLQEREKEANITPDDPDLQMVMALFEGSASSDLIVEVGKFSGL